VQGKAPGPGTVRLRIDLADSNGHALCYRVTTKADTTGHFELCVPYATQGGTSDFRARGPARVRWNDGTVDKHAQVTIPDAAVQSAATVRCDLM